MRLSADVISSSEQRSNPLGEREIVLRGLAIPSIEHLGATRDQFDAIDLSDNSIVRLENFPRLNRLESLYCSSNDVEGADGRNLGANLPQLRNLYLDRNRITSLGVLKELGENCKHLECLSLRGNPITSRQHYRLYAISSIPTLKILDYARVTKAERDRADRLSRSAAGAALESDVRAEARADARRNAKNNGRGGTEDESGGVKTFEPGVGPMGDDGTGAGAGVMAKAFTAAQREAIRKMVENAASPEEIERIEGCVRRGVFPGKEGEEQVPSTPPLTEDGERKRIKAEGGTEAAASKKARTN
uniref:U2A'/phosphoprotein 32 family A C-terminal domain-containing protein n=1 Tax=Trieres chinensis TaxID=1514140 RepID=A0A7S1ZH85_TRICV|mmetsp:Transcript_25645/g.52516  ORF Transcript_25645/g.52516 Transcript_25645/m.52516 type:complete len:303 (+) Transcript_25645:247-1155(+)|eukprot:CAMPEP_0183292344 /NCGR_PEP_ID=MMETSP0160_2-20130417/1433_1 /TAXON_ID=2839 ORGANISM="Odontella Sinensis, Strain Grunow 1884" /NCGR_SAMPLE_ID=MMETSP0160_2 /ASSEMBLY_ACC=CAM_ASM_000250 /LENGTH=302 /DNA_ID=CAMNT_0025453279 /DNA_START=210 /DNA_END=1118 /DNA_ORIENTATION=-